MIMVKKLNILIIYILANNLVEQKKSTGRKYVRKKVQESFVQ